MPRYIDEDDLIRAIELDAICNRGKFSKKEIIRCIKNAPTADVESTSVRMRYIGELAEAKAEVQSLMIELDAMRGAANSYKMHYKKASAASVNEIFKDIERMLDTCIWAQEVEIRTSGAFGLNDVEKFRHRKKAIEDIKEYLQFIKKKYMEERLNEQRQSGDQDIQLQGMREPQHPNMH